MSFESLGLHAALTQALSEAGYTTATEVQLQAVPPALQGRDLRVQSQTGSGKTASFMLPVLTRTLAAFDEFHAQKGKPGAPFMQRLPKALVLAPTRELAQQVAQAAQSYGRHVRGLRVATIVGGVPYGLQLKMLRGGCDLIIATPGRLMDLMQSGNAVLSQISTFVVDEADRMLDLGFIDDIHHIAQALPKERQTLMYSATFGGRVGALADELLRNPLEVNVATHTHTHADIEQRMHWADDLRHKNALLEHLLADRDIDQALIFTSTQVDADWLAGHLADLGHEVGALHGGMPQGRRNRVLRGLRERHFRVLVATDVAARGIDVPSISHVINYGLPMKAEDYVHRIGRTGRAGRAGLAVTLAERRDAGMMHRIQRFTTQRIPAVVIAGLEPKRAEEPRPPQPGFKPGFKAGFKPGPKPGFKPGFKGGFKPEFKPEFKSEFKPEGFNQGFKPGGKPAFKGKPGSAPGEPFAHRGERQGPQGPGGNARGNFEGGREEPRGFAGAPRQRRATSSPAAPSAFPRRAS